MKKALFTLLLLFLSLVVAEISLRAFGALVALSSGSSGEVKSGVKLIVTLGESTTANGTYLDDHSWPTILQARFDAKNFPLQIVNRAKVGTTSPALVDAFINEFAAKRVDLVIAMMGVNDRPEFWLRDHFLVQKPGFWANLRIYKILRLMFSQIEGSITERRTITPSIDLVPESEKVFDQIRMKQSTASAEQSLSRLPPESRARAYAAIANRLRPDWGSPPRTHDESFRFAKMSLAASLLVENLPQMYLLEAAMLNKQDECDWLAKRFLEERLQPNDVEMFSFATCSRNSPSVQKLFQSSESRFVIHEGSDRPTRASYNVLHDFLRARDICLVAVQYPRRSPAELKSLFDNDDLVFFSANSENFDEALKARPFEDVFSDRFARVFGHTTRLGSEILAESVAKAVAEALADPRCQHPTM